MAKGKNSHSADANAASTTRRLARLEGVVENLVESSFADQLESLNQKLANEVMEREVQDKVLLTYIKTLQLQTSASLLVGSTSTAQGAAQVPTPTCSVAEAVELSAQQELVRAQLAAFSQVFQGDLASLQRALNELKERMDILEVRTQVAVEQRLDKEATVVADKVAESLEHSVRAVQKTPTNPGRGVQTKEVNQSGPCTLLQVEALVSEAVAKVRTEWKNDLESEKASNSEGKRELGRVLVKEFERSIVSHHAERLAVLEGKLKVLCTGWEKAQSTGETNESQGIQATADRDFAALLAEVNETELRKSHPPTPVNAVDISPLQAEMKRLVAIVQGLQTQSEQFMGMLEEGKAELKTEVRVRSQEDQRVELACREKLTELKDKLAEEVWALLSPMPSSDREKSFPTSKVDAKACQESCIQHLHSILSSDLAKLNTEAGSSGAPTQLIDSTNQSQSSENSRKVQFEQGRDTSVLVEDLRSTMLSYFRSEFQDYIGETLQKMQRPQGRSPAFSTSYTPGLGSRSPRENSRSRGAGTPGSPTAGSVGPSLCTNTSGPASIRMSPRGETIMRVPIRGGSMAMQTTMRGTAASSSTAPPEVPAGVSSQGGVGTRATPRGDAVLWGPSAGGSMLVQMQQAAKGSTAVAFGSAETAATGTSPVPNAPPKSPRTTPRNGGAPESGIVDASRAAVASRSVSATLSSAGTPLTAEAMHSPRQPSAGALRQASYGAASRSLQVQVQTAGTTTPPRFNS